MLMVHDFMIFTLIIDKGGWFFPRFFPAVKIATKTPGHKETQKVLL
jgi:hypothetical protein